MKILFINRRILEEIFKIAPEQYQEKDLSNHTLTKKLNISGEELIKSINFLIEMGLIRRIVLERKPTLYSWQITEKGFNYLEEKAKEDKFTNLQTLIVYFTLIIAINGIIEALLLINPEWGILFRVSIFWVYLFSLLVVLIKLLRIKK